uniref:DIRP domain-containing protein n=1 Tax=Globisporangium ultimum (strain ATCC 200006 / CBS 805.95 / DAOM BR144) TaxID=431595 RepID=K3WA22_GLOUD
MRDNLGPRWSSKELRTFYILLRAQGGERIQWEKLQEKLPQRSAAMIRALFDTHRGYLALPGASVDDFCTIAADYHKKIEERSLSRTIAGASGGGGDAVADSMDVKMESIDNEELQAGHDDVAMHQDQQLDATDDGTAVSSVVNRIRKRDVSLTPTTNAIASATTALQSSSKKDKVKKRRLDRLLAWDAAGDQLEKQAQMQLQIKSEDEGERALSGPVTSQSLDAGARRSRHAKVRMHVFILAVPPKVSAMLIPLLLLFDQRKQKSVVPWRVMQKDPSLLRLHGYLKKLDLPWFYWFYSFVDVDFFNHNEFVECLERMGLGKVSITDNVIFLQILAAARPIWSSVRASMGRPRRLSQLFFAQEKAKLESYRMVKRALVAQKAPESWPFTCLAPVEYGANVIVRLANPHRFAFGIVLHYVSGEDGVCTVKLATSAESEPIVCSLDSVMVLERTFFKEEVPERADSSTTLQQEVSTVNGVSQSTFAGTTHGNTGASGWRNSPKRRQDTIRAIIAVKDLLHRKEQLVSALTKMNATVRSEREQEREANRHTGRGSGDSSVGAGHQSLYSDDVLSTASILPSILQRQYAWLVVNLDLTNCHLQDALVRLQACARQRVFCSSAPLLFSIYESQGGDDENDAFASRAERETSSDHNGSLSLEHMKWAVSFLALSQKKAEALVAASIPTTGSSDAAARDTHEAIDTAVPQSQGLPDDTKQLIAMCLCFMSVVRRGTSTTSPRIPALVTQKLMERLLELLEPRYDGNMDLYAELRAAAEGVIPTLHGASSM